MELIVGLIVVFIVGAVIASGLSGKCPSCGKWWGLKEVERREVGREPGMKTVTRTETQRDTHGNMTQVQRQVQVHVMRIKYDGSFRCSSCGHTLNKIMVREKEEW
jgi:ribosomal protein L44E